MLYPDPSENKITAAGVLDGYGGRLLPISIAIGIFFLGLHVFRREAPWFAERV